MESSPGTTQPPNSAATGLPTAASSPSSSTGTPSVRSRLRRRSRPRPDPYPVGCQDCPDAQTWHDAVVGLRAVVAGCEELLLCAAGHCVVMGQICPVQKGGGGPTST